MLGTRPLLQGSVATLLRRILCCLHPHRHHIVMLVQPCEGEAAEGEHVVWAFGGATGILW